ncbi:hypothetical protein [Falsirhodobacter deserti]|uniref:hypothetical protein n=1 Tax=Falsirhodobacter deserti TaxID=1365611 RepID=UPI000FE2C842|nr:hypothetical protein [Falsirhodobacter deserti]
MAWLVALGAVLCLGGIGGLGWCIMQALRARREGLEGEVLQARFRKLTLVNTAALGVSALGLMMVVAGVILS